MTIGRQKLLQTYFFAARQRKYPFSRKLNVEFAREDWAGRLWARSRRGQSLAPGAQVRRASQCSQKIRNDFFFRTIGAEIANPGVVEKCGYLIGKVSVAISRAHYKHRNPLAVEQFRLMGLTNQVRPEWHESEILE